MLITMLTSCATWSRADKALLAASWGAAGADFYTSERAFDNPANHELNPIIGKHPTDTELITYMLISQTAVTLLAHVCPRWRSWLLGGKAVINTGCAINNNRLD